MQGRFTYILSNHGAASIAVIFAMMLLYAVCGAFLLLSRTEFQAAVNYKDGICAQYLAEAGARRSIIEIMNNPHWKGCTETIDSSGQPGKYQVTVRRDSGTGNFIIVSIGTVNEARKLVRVTLDCSKTAALETTNLSQKESGLPEILQWSYF